MPKNRYPGRPYPVGQSSWELTPERQAKVDPLKIKRFALLERGEAEILFDMPRILRLPGDYLNLGHGAGGSAMLLAQGLEDQRIPGIVHSIDIFKRQPWSGSFDGTFNNAWMAVKEVHLDNRIQLYQGPTTTFVDKFDRLSFVFIDADHSYEGVKADFVNYAPKIIKGGAVAFHDTNQEPSHRVIVEHIQSVDCWQLTHHVNRIKVFRRL